MTRRTLRAAVLLPLAVSLLTGCGGTREPRPASIREPLLPAGRLSGAIVFVRPVERDETALMRLDLASVTERRLPAPAGLVSAPALSPDGSRLSYSVSDPSAGTSHLWVARADGSRAQQITDGDVVDDYPAWSPDGTMLVFSSLRGGGDWHLYRVGADGTGLERLTDGAGHHVSPVWAPSGDAIVFSRLVDRDYDLWRLDLRDRRLHRLTDLPADELEPTISPDNTRATFSWSGGVPGPQIHSLDLATGHTEPLIVSDTIDTSPAFSPDGEFVALSAGHLAVYRADGEDIDSTAVRWRLTEHVARMPTWGPVP